MLNKENILQLNSIGISESTVLEQFELLKKNDSFITISGAATPENGITKVDDIEKYVEIYDSESRNFHISKFVPASGAATRMFKRLIAFYQESNTENLHDGDFYSVKTTFEKNSEFAFFNELKSLSSDNDNMTSIANLILFDGLGYANLPKGLIDFHKYSDHSRTAFEEHIHEAIAMIDKSNPLDIHLTISREFFEKFNKKLMEIQKKEQLNINVSFSFQEPSTNTIAIYHDGSLVKEQDGKLLLRPGGHGALLQNLNKIDSDIVFIKNIDNVVHESFLSLTIKYKKLIGGILIEAIGKISHYYSELNKPNPSPAIIEEAILYLGTTFGARFNENSNICEQLLKYLNRPIRVCGMVKNTGEPGGGPFWVIDSDGNESLQIVEKAQLDLSKPDQKEHFNNSTHFNPVDLVCYLKDPEGQKFDLNNFVDKEACFISEKTHFGKHIRVLEHPGLWNGAMSNWLTIFVEVPLVTFNPVKELNDLLRKEHQG
jgi:hypothetical protein